MKIITTTIEDFIQQQIAEYGHDYIETQFASGYEPMQVNGIWCWCEYNASRWVPVGTSTNTCAISVLSSVAVCKIS